MEEHGEVLADGERDDDDPCDPVDPHDGEDGGRHDQVAHGQVHQVGRAVVVQAAGATDHQKREGISEDACREGYLSRDAL